MKINKKYVSIIMSSLILSSSILSVSQAQTLESNNSQVIIKKIDDNTLRVNTKNTSESVSVVEKNDIKIVTIKDLKTGKSNELKFDYKNHTFYSSYTNKIIKYSNNNDLIASMYKDRMDTSYSTVRLSYAQIREKVGERATAGGVVGLVVGFIPGAQPVAGLIGGISTILGALSYAIPNDNKHGLIFRIKTTKFYRNRDLGRHVYKTTNNIVGVERF